MKDYSHLHIIIVAAGTGTRFGADVPKQFVSLAGRPVLMTTIDRFREIAPNARITLVVSSEMTDFWAELCAKHSFVSPEIALGGSSRAESVKNALANISEKAQFIAVHDGVRPFVTADILDAALEAVESGAQGAIPVTPVTDSLRELTADGSSEPVNRSKFRAVQTPQLFNAKALLAAYRQPVSEAMTDDASVMALAGYTDVVLTEGSPYNIKITNPCDLIIAEALLSSNILS